MSKAPLMIKLAAIDGYTQAGMQHAAGLNKEASVQAPLHELTGKAAALDGYIHAGMMHKQADDEQDAADKAAAAAAQRAADIRSGVGRATTNKDLAAEKLRRAQEEAKKADPGFVDRLLGASPDTTKAKPAPKTKFTADEVQAAREDERKRVVVEGGIGKGKQLLNNIRSGTPATDAPGDPQFDTKGQQILDALKAAPKALTYGAGGALAGAGIGAAVGDPKKRMKSALLGALAGGALGAGVGGLASQA